MPKRIFVLALLGALLLIIKGFALAWVEPTQAPPAGNVPAPLNVGNGYQIKSGVLQIKNPDASSADATEGNWFHIGTYNKTFAQAKAACEAQGARLAYYSEIVDAFKNGANACSYGWISEGFVVYPMQDGATGGCGGSVGGVRVSRPALTATYGAYCARDSFLINGSLANGGNLYAKGLYLNSGQSAGQMYFGLLDNGSNADKLGICFDGDCKTAWDQVVGAPTNATYLTISSDATLTNERIVTAGTGVTITDGGVGGNLTINVNPITVQTRVASAGCVAGSSIRVINQDGSVVCEVDDSGSGGTVGPGIINRIAKFTAASTIGDSIITDNGANVGIGDTTPSSKLDVAAPSTALPTVLLNRVAGQSSIKSSDTNGYLLLDSNGSAAGLNWYSADNVILANGGGKVGIGTTAPSTKLDINGQIRIRGGVPGAGKVLTSDATGLATWQTPSSGGAPTTVSYLTLALDGTLSAERVLTAGTGIAITDGGANGNLTINVNPASVQTRIVNSCTGANLSIKTINQDGTMTCEIDDSGSGGTVGPGTINRIAKFTAASTIGDSIITDNGTNIGIGIVNPTYKLHILKPSGASGSSAIKVENDNAGQPVGIEIDKADAGGSAGVYYSTNGAAKWFAGTYTNNGYSLRDTTAGATRLYIDSTGNVGIGITAPTSLLHIAQSQSAMPANTPLVLLQTTGTAASTKGSLLHLYTTRGTGTDDTDLFKISNSGGSTFMTVRNTGNIGVGVANPRTLLHLSSSGSALRLEDNNSDGVGAVNYLEFYDSNSRQGYLGFGSSVNSDMFFTNEENGNWIFSGSGGMGISTTTPYGAKLNVSGGPIKASGGLILENRTTDVASPESGAIWICVDTGNDCH